MQDFRKLVVWQKGHELTLRVYGATKRFPADERFGLTSQMRRASSSIPMNIAEACGKGGRKEFRQYLRTAAGSASELEYQFILARDLTYLSPAESNVLLCFVQEVKRMLVGFLERFESSSDNDPLQPAQKLKTEN